MRYVIWMVILTGVAVLLFTAKRNLPEIRDYRQSRTLYLASLLKPGGYLILALMVLSTLFASVHQVPAGHIGVVYEFGGIKGQIGEGLQFVAPWRDVLLANIQVQRRVFDKLSAFSEESQDVFVRASLNVALLLKPSNSSTVPSAPIFSVSWSNRGLFRISKTKP